MYWCKRVGEDKVFFEDWYLFIGKIENIFNRNRNSNFVVGMFR